MDKLTLPQYMKLLVLGHPSHIRDGQHAFNVLCVVRPDLSEQIRTTELDPFYNDGRLPSFISWLTEHWWDDV